MCTVLGKKCNCPCPQGLQVFGERDTTCLISNQRTYSRKQNMVIQYEVVPTRSTNSLMRLLYKMSSQRHHILPPHHLPPHQTPTWTIEANFSTLFASAFLVSGLEALYLVCVWKFAKYHSSISRSDEAFPDFPDKIFVTIACWKHWSYRDLCSFCLPMWEFRTVLRMLGC